jgi:post-segregation antitoxin (ccd killing protein)
MINRRILMGYSKISVTIPDEVYIELKTLASDRKVKVSHLVTDALAEKIRKLKEDEFVRQINDIFADSEVAEEQHSMAEEIARSTELKELPW